MKKRLHFQSSDLIRHAVFPSLTFFGLKYYSAVAENLFINWLQMKVEKNWLPSFLYFFWSSSAISLVDPSFVHLRASKFNKLATYVKKRAGKKVGVMEMFICICQLSGHL